MSDCPICRGSGSIRLPVYTPAKMTPEPVGIMPDRIDDASRRYACPECSHEKADEDAIHVAHSRTVIDERYAIDPDCMRSVEKWIAKSLADEFLRSGMISFSTKPDLDTYGVVVTGKLGVVRPSKVSSIEKRAMAAAQEVIDAVVDKAEDAIRLWGSDYTGMHGLINKDDAVRSMREGIRTAIKEKLG